MRWLQLHLRSRRVPLALTTVTALIALAWALSLAYTDSTTINARTASLAIMLAVVAVGTTLDGADGALDHTMAVNWPVRRAGHLLLAAATITALLSLSMITDTRYEPFALLLRNTAGLLGLTALGATVLGAALCLDRPAGLDPDRGAADDGAQPRPEDAGRRLADPTRRDHRRHRLRRRPGGDRSASRTPCGVAPCGR